MNSLHDFIVRVKGAIAPSLCDEIVREYQNSNKWKAGELLGGLAAEVRNCQVLGMVELEVKRENPAQRERLDYDVFRAVGKCFKHYQSLNPHFTVNSDSGYQLLRYREGMFYEEHVDVGPGVIANRVLSCSLCLNDEFTGGEFGFFSNSYKVDLSKGDALLFPSNFLFPHQINEVTSGVRYSIVTWGIL